MDPTDPGDAVTLNYITKNQDSLLTQLRNTGAAQNSSIVSTGDSQNARLNATGDNQNTRLNTTGDTQDKRLNDLGQKYVDLMTTLKDTATTKATEAGNSAELSKKWAMSSSSPDGVTGNKSSKTWAEEAKTSAGNSAASASSSASSATASASYATNSSNSANASKQSANASANSAFVSASSASDSAISASNAKISETNAANSAKAAKQSEENSKTWDPAQYARKEYVDAVNKTITDMKEKYIFRFEIIPKADMTRDAEQPARIYMNSPVPQGYERLTVNCTTGGIATTLTPDMTSNSSKIDDNLALWVQGYAAADYYDRVWNSIENISIFTIFVKKEG